MLSDEIEAAVPRHLEHPCSPLNRHGSCTTTNSHCHRAAETGQASSTNDRETSAATRLAALGEYGEAVLTERNLHIAAATNTIADERGCSTPQVAIAWVLAQRHRAVIVPIIGARTRRQLDDNLAALDVELNSDEMAGLDAASQIPLGFPHDFPGRAMAYGQTYALVDSHRGTIWPDL